MLPVVAVGPVAMDWVLVQGTRAGLYDTEFRVALFALGNILLLTVLILWTARRTDRLDAQRCASEAMFRRALENAPFPAMVHAEDGLVVVLNHAWLANTGYQREEIVTVTDWIDRAHGGRGTATIRAATKRLYALNQQTDQGEFVLRAADGSQRIWSCYASPLGRDASSQRLVLSMAVDLTFKKEADERQRLLMREVDHRAKNALAVVQAILRLTKAATPADFAAAVGGRINAMAYAHTLLAENKWSGVDIAALVRNELAGFGHDGDERVVLSGPAVAVRAEATQALALVLHELAVNAAHHGALSTARGRVLVTWSVREANRQRPNDGRTLHLWWRERDGLALEGPPACLGFGSTLIGQTIRHQLAGTVAMDWQQEGLLCTIMLPETCFSTAGITTLCSPVAADETSPSAASTTRKARVLLVEDEPLVAMATEATLTDAGYNVMGPAGRVQEAMDLLLRERPDAAVLDVNLFGQPVYPVAEKLLEMGVPFVFCTGYTQLDVRNERLRHVPVLAKPISGNKLLVAIDALLAVGATESRMPSVVGLSAE